MKKRASTTAKQAKRTTKRPARTTTRLAGESPAERIAAFVAKFDAPVATLIRATRRALRERLPTAVEMVYDNYNFLVFGFGATERVSDVVVSLAAASNGVSLSFYRGATLPDPDGVLLGAGKQNRFVRLPSAATLAQPAVERLLREAVARAPTPLPPAGEGGYTVVKSVSAKQRPRRSTK